MDLESGNDIHTGLVLNVDSNRAEMCLSSPASATKSFLVPTNITLAERDMFYILGFSEKNVQIWPFSTNFDLLVIIKYLVLFVSNEVFPCEW